MATVCDDPPAVARLDGPTLGAVLQFGLLAGLGATVGIRPGGWIAAAAFALATFWLLRAGLRRSRMRRLGAANRVTLVRAILVGGVAALAADSVTGTVPISVVVTLTVVALLLDAVDGQVARRTRSTSALGARFDMEVDAFLILALCVLLIRPVGPWVLAIGGMRYAFVIAGRLLPWMAAPLPPRFSRKVVAAVQGIVLVVAVAGVLPARTTVAALWVALAALCWSFGRDTIWLARSRRSRRASEGGEEPVTEGAHPPDRGLRAGLQAVLPAP